MWGAVLTDKSHIKIGGTFPVVTYGETPPGEALAAGFQPTPNPHENPPCQSDPPSSTPNLSVPSRLGKSCRYFTEAACLTHNPLSTHSLTGGSRSATKSDGKQPSLYFNNIFLLSLFKYYIN